MTTLVQDRRAQTALTDDIQCDLMFRGYDAFGPLDWIALLDCSTLKYISEPRLARFLGSPAEPEAGIAPFDEAPLPRVDITPPLAESAASAAGVPGASFTSRQDPAPTGSTLAADGGFTRIAAADGTADYFAFAMLTDGFGENKLDQCVAINAGQPLTIAYSVYATRDASAAGLAVRVNPTFFASLGECATAVTTDDSDRALPGARADDDIDFVLGTGGGAVLIQRTEVEDPALTYAANDIPAGATHVRLSVRARDRSEMMRSAKLAFVSVSLTQGGMELVQNPTLAAGR